MIKSTKGKISKNDSVRSKEPITANVNLAEVLQTDIIRKSPKHYTVFKVAQALGCERVKITMWPNGGLILEGSHKLLSA